MAGMKEATSYISLEKAISSLKAELLKAQLAAQSDGTLSLTECEVELSMEFQPSAEIGANLFVVSFKGGANAKGTHKVKVKLVPLQAMVLQAQKAGGSRPAKTPPKRPTGGGKSGR
jgi:hypothetical protein